MADATPSGDTVRYVPDVTRVLLAAHGNSELSPGSDLPENEFAGLILFRDHEPVAAIGCVRESAETLAVTDPILIGSNRHADRRTLTLRLLAALPETAVSQGCSVIRILQPDSNTASSIDACLTESGFRCVARVTRWRCACLQAVTDSFPVTVSADDRIQIQRLSSEEHGCTSTLTEIKEALHDILRNSSELQQLPRPRADELLGSWMDTHQLLAAVVPESGTTGQNRGECIGLLAWCPDPAAENFGGMGFQVSYVGVRPMWRRQGIARRLFRSLTDHVAGTAPASLFLWSDVDNQPAASLYRTLGFEATGTWNVWCRSVCHSSSPAAGSGSGGC